MKKETMAIPTVRQKQDKPRTDTTTQKNLEITVLSGRNETKKNTEISFHKALDKETHLERRKLACQLFWVGVGRDRRSRDTLRVRDSSSSLTAAMASRVYTFVNVIKLYVLNVHSLLC